MTGSWQVEGAEAPQRFFNGYHALHRFMEIDGSDTDFFVSLLDAEYLEDNLGWHFPYFIAEGQVRNGELHFAEVKIPEEACEFWYDLDTYAMDYPTVETWEKMANFHHEYGIDKPDY